MVIVVDTNVLVAATLSPFGASFQILSLLPERRFELLLSVPLMLEYEEVLKREDMRAPEPPDPRRGRCPPGHARGRRDTVHPLFPVAAPTA